ncbi:hypothetical protein PSU4_19210 [Pseudonocardia sulfidoxydans NBRC 16205]|uniref:Uncharacterized protein n=1 Tax=Pseudonocardia sulfidoxydans NBRC 16205 TaxID=1223511 RepID=A0A511DEK2_9PSEU|nr:hypothetical protein PSU4_19210 [Pseudonocardia sulfidoxydans NBRC 16205]
MSHAYGSSVCGLGVLSADCPQAGVLGGQASWAEALRAGSAALFHVKPLLFARGGEWRDSATWIGESESVALRAGQTRLL